MENIGLYRQLTEFTSENAGMSEWCKATRDGETFFIKKFQSPVYPSPDIGLPEAKYNARVARFHKEMGRIKTLYDALRENDESGIPLIPVEVMNYRFHICTIAPFLKGNLKPEQVCRLSEWQRLTLMRSLTRALMDVHRAGIVHSDMKPDNAIITQESDGKCLLRLIDFDSSYFEAELPQDIEDINGDPAYFAPEVYGRSAGQSTPIDRRADVFALGVVLHYYWCGKLPTCPEGRTVGEAALNGDPIKLDDSLPLVLQKLIERMLEKDPEARASLQSVYNVLVAQLERCPMELVQLAEEIPREAAKPAAPSHPAAPERADDGEQPRLTLRLEDSRGNLIEERTEAYAYGKTVWIAAPFLMGYEPSEPTSKSVAMNWHGMRAEPLIFRYDREKSGPNLRVVIGIALAVVLVAFILLYSLE